ncbi:hypothetical protein LP419_03330 [Massilia sp. H-1]|nr:hypothetical protein LP419_03330 [Massilia sp. H-1]
MQGSGAQQAAWLIAAGCQHRVRREGRLPRVGRARQAAGQHACRGRPVARQQCLRHQSDQMPPGHRQRRRPSPERRRSGRLPKPYLERELALTGA